MAKQQTSSTSNKNTTTGAGQAAAQAASEIVGKAGEALKKEASHVKRGMAQTIRDFIFGAIFGNAYNALIGRGVDDDPSDGNTTTTGKIKKSNWGSFGRTDERGYERARSFLSPVDVREIGRFERRVTKETVYDLDGFRMTIADLFLETIKDHATNPSLNPASEKLRQIAMEPNFNRQCLIAGSNALKEKILERKPVRAISAGVFIFGLVFFVITIGVASFFVFYIF